MSDVAVIGAGIVGLAVAFSLREQGASVQVFERGEPGNGQSGGDERLFRHGHDDPRLAAIARESRALWDAWERRLGVELVSRDGALAIGPAVERRARILAEAGVAARLVDAAEHTPLLGGPGGAALGTALLDEDAGSIRVAVAVAALAAQVPIVRDEVLAVGADGTVHAGGRTERFGRVVVCAGAGTAGLVRDAGLEVPVEVTIHARATFAVRGTPPARLPCWQDSSGAFGETGVYGAPAPGNARFSIGVGATAPPGDAAALDDMVARASAYVTRAMPLLDAAPVGVRHCTVTTLPWGDDGVAVWQAGAVVAVAGNNLFKHAPWLGREVARVALGAPLHPDLRPDARLGAS